MSTNYLQIANTRFNYLQSWYTKGILFISGTDIRVQIVEWDKLLDFIIQNLILPEHSEYKEINDYNEISLGKIINSINSRPFSLPTKYNNHEIHWAHKIRNQLVHDIHFNFNDQKENIIKAIDILEETCSHILKYYELENNWETLK